MGAIKNLTVCFALQGDSHYGNGLAQAKLMLQSVRQHMPQALVIQLSNETYPAVPGIDRFLRRPNEGDFIRWAFQSMCGLFHVVNGPILQIATDIIIRRDVSHVFTESFDVAACPYPPKDRTDGTYCGDTNFIQPSGRRVWLEALAYYERTPHIKDGWEGGQTAMLWAFRQPNVKILDLDFDTYNFTPEGPGQVPDSAAIVHYRGRRKLFMQLDQDLLNKGVAV